MEFFKVVIGQKIRPDPAGCLNRVDEFRSNLLKAGLPSSVSEVIAYFLNKEEKQFEEKLYFSPGTVVYSLDDVSICVHLNHYQFRDYIEVLNPYSEEEFVLIDGDDFKEVVSCLLNGRPLGQVNILSSDSRDRSDYDESKVYW